MIHIDHVALAVPELYSGATRFTEETGLATFDAGWFPTWGVGNRMSPLGASTYIEILGVVEPNPENHGPVAQWTLQGTAGGDIFMGWCARVDSREELDEIAARIGGEIFLSGGMRGPDGKFEPAPFIDVADGTEDPSARTPDTASCWQQGLPNFFVIDQELHFGDRPAPHKVQPQGISWLEVGGTEEKMREWLGPEAELPLVFNGRDPGLYAIGIATDNGEVVVRR